MRTTDGRPLRKHLTPIERARLIETWYRPHHQRLTQLVEHVIADRKSCVIVDCHSFASRPLPHEPEQDPVRPDICIGTDGWHTPARLRDALVAAASAGRFSVLVDRPFAGALVPAKHYRREPKAQAIMIEVNRRLYMDEATSERLPSFGEVKQAVSEMLAVAGR